MRGVAGGYPTLASLVAGLAETANYWRRMTNADQASLTEGRARCVFGMVLMGKPRRGYWPI